MTRIVPVKLWAIDESSMNRGLCKFCDAPVIFAAKRYRAKLPIAVLNADAKLFRGHVRAADMHRCSRRRGRPIWQ